jgi:hypothetical protein
MRLAKDFGVLAVVTIAAIATGATGATGCAGPTAPGMAVVSSSGTSSGPGSMLVAFPDSATRLYVVSSRDVTAQPGTWFRRHEIARPPERVEKGIVIEVSRTDAKNCHRNATPAPELVTFETATRATKDLKWLDVRADEGTRWLDEHRARVTQLLETPPATPAPAVTTITRVP